MWSNDNKNTKGAAIITENRENWRRFMGIVPHSHRNKEGRTGRKKLGPFVRTCGHSLTSWSTKPTQVT